MQSLLKNKRSMPPMSMKFPEMEERINFDASMYKELKNVKRISPGGYLIERSIFNHGQKNAYDQYKRYICYHNNDAKNIYCKAMVKQWLESNRWFLIRGHSAECRNKNLADWEIQQFIERVEKFYLTEGRRKNGFKTCKKESKSNSVKLDSIGKRRIRCIKKRVQYVEQDEIEDQGKNEDEIRKDNVNDGKDKTKKEERNRNQFEEAYKSSLDQLNAKDEEIKMLKNTIDKLLNKIEEERRVKEKLKEIIVSLKNDTNEVNANTINK